MWRLCNVQQDLLQRKQFFNNFMKWGPKGGDFNSCGKWSSRVLPVMLWWSLAWFPYFYSGCPRPYCESGEIPQKVFSKFDNIWWKGLQKLQNEFDSHDVFFGQTNCYCPLLQVGQKAILIFKCLAYFCNPLIK